MACSLKKVTHAGRLSVEVLLLVIISDFSLGLVVEKFAAEHADTRAVEAQFRILADLPWGRSYINEFNKSSITTYQPYIGWRRKDFVGEYINIKDGLRRTVQRLANKSKRVFMFGGSTMWGTGARDSHTIPSEFAAFELGAGRNLEVVNFGESGYVIWQEALLLADRCASGDSPDLVIFYDGINDVFAKLQSPNDHRPHQNLQEWRRRYDNRKAEIWSTEPIGWIALRKYATHSCFAKAARGIARLTTQSVGYPRFIEAETVPEPVLIDSIVAEYIEAKDFIIHLSHAYGFKVLFFWQPSLYSKANISVAEKSLLKSIRDFDGEFYRREYLQVTRKIQDFGDIICLAGVFDHQHDIYLDMCHTTEAGNKLIAGAIAKYIPNDF